MRGIWMLVSGTLGPLTEAGSPVFGLTLREKDLESGPPHCRTGECRREGRFSFRMRAMDSGRPRATMSKWVGLLAVAVAVMFGVLGGLGFFTFGYGKGLSYLSNDPAACANCHVMQAHYDSWQIRVIMQWRCATIAICRITSLASGW